MSTVTVNPPKTPVTEKSNGTAPAGPPNMCKMPGPPAPFVPSPLPNIGQSSDNLSDCTTTVKIEGAKVAIKGTYFMSKGDMASKGTGGGMVSATTHGKTEFVGPGSMDVKFQGKMVQFLGDAMTNNGNVANAATIKELQDAKSFGEMKEAIVKIAKECEAAVNKPPPDGKGPPNSKNCKTLGTAKHKCCENAIKDANNPKARSEVPYDKAGKEIDPAKFEAAEKAASAAYNAAKTQAQALFFGPVGAAMAIVGVPAAVAGGIAKACVTLATKGVYMKALYKASGLYLKADVVLTNSKNQKFPFDFKFPCSGKKGKIKADQQRKYLKVFGRIAGCISP